MQEHHRPLTNTVAIVTGASSGIGAATARQLAALGATVALVARREDRLQENAAAIANAGGSSLVVPADITVQSEAERAVARVVEAFGRIDVLINNAGLMILGPVSDGDVAQWERMIDINQKGLLFMTNAALPHLLDAAEHSERRVADIVNISSIAGRVAWANYGVYNMTKFGVNGFTEALRQEVTKRHVRVGVLEPGGVSTELGSHNSGAMRADIDSFYDTTETLLPEDVAEGVAFMVTRPRRASIGELWVMPSDQA
ncbi:SDR family oxidoreductase [Humidisolicoccus flavus]|uniref:SDR family oxidoreductase n=1 Tax=Humidisolicoccus flavus TaxID=3111414 RepID=UPI00324A277E